MSGTTPTPGSKPGDENNPYAQPGEPVTGPPPAGQPPAWSGPTGDPNVYQERPAPPTSILNAVKLMYVGAALSLVGMIFTLASRDAIRDAIIEGDSNLSASEVDTAVNVVVGIGVVVGILAAALWLWMAAVNKKGKSWAKVVATILGGLNILFTLLSLANGGGGLAVLTNVISLVLAAVILWFLYRPESSQYYAAMSRATH